MQAEEDEGELVGRHFRMYTELEFLYSDQDGITWLVINEVHICYIRKDRGTNKTTGNALEGEDWAVNSR